MQNKLLFAMCLVFAFVIISMEAGGGKKKHKVIVHIPYHVKTIKHTHTIYKTIHHKKHDHKHHDDHDHKHGHDHGHYHHGGW